MNIFFTGAVRGGRAQQPSYAHIIKGLERHGAVFSQHVSNEELSEYGETSLSGEEILERELETLSKSDMVVAEVTVPSLGVGYLIARATALQKKVIALYNGEDALKLSGIVKGDALVEVCSYENDRDLEKIFKRVFSASKSA